MRERSAALSVDGRQVKVTSPDRVLYPETGTTKSDVIDYYLAVADAVLPALAGRPVTRKRWPEGVNVGQEFFAKDLELGSPAWLSRVQVQHGSGPKFYPVIDSPAALAWCGQVSALELHVPQWRFADPTRPAAPATTSKSQRHPDRIVFDLDPGPGTGLAECVEVAMLLRERLGPLGSRLLPVTSGSQCLHIYVPMDDPITSDQAAEWAKLVAEQLQVALWFHESGGVADSAIDQLVFNGQP